MEIIKALKGEGWKSELQMIVAFACIGILMTGLLYWILQAMESPMGGQRAAAGVMCLCFIGGIGLLLSLLMILLMSIDIILLPFSPQIPSIGLMFSPIVYNAIFLVVLINVPKWDKIVVNVRDGYHDFQRIHEGEPREGQYRMAEHCAELTRPIWEWLAKDK